MNKKNQDFKGRRSILTGMGVAAAGLAVGATAVSAQAASTGFKPARHEQDAWLDKMPGDHRVFIDSATPLGGAEALPYAMNLFNAQVGAYGGSPDDFAMVVCFRHFSHHDRCRQIQGNTDRDLRSCNACVFGFP